MPRHFSLIVTFAYMTFFAGCASNPAVPNAPMSQSAAASRWENKLVRRPGSGPEDTKVYLVKDGRRHWIVNASWITSHGYNWPADVNEIPPAELDAIPQGDAIQ